MRSSDESDKPEKTPAKGGHGHGEVAEPSPTPENVTTDLPGGSERMLEPTPDVPAGGFLLIRAEGVFAGDQPVKELSLGVTSLEEVPFALKDIRAFLDELEQGMASMLSAAGKTKKPVQAKPMI